MKINLNRPAGIRVTVMGLGLHGGGLASTLFFANRGARVTVTDLRDEKTLKPSLDRLTGLEIRTVLGRHDQRDFIDTDLVIKSPAVPASSTYLKTARLRGVPIETDLSVFMRLMSNPIIAITGSKGKSTTASMIYHCIKEVYPGARLGGNITVSPLTFLEELKAGDPVVLELSSWQLGDLKGSGLLAPAVSVVTIILTDHQDKYPDMQSYIADKKVIFTAQGPKDYAVFNYDDPYQESFTAETGADVHYFSDHELPVGVEGAFLRNQSGMVRLGGKTSQIFTGKLSVTGTHNRMNLLAAGLAAVLFGVKPAVAKRMLQSFPGIEHRLEYFHQINGVKFYNDSTSTIPQATVAALKSLKPPIVLITGGTDKNIDFTPLLESIRIADYIVLLQGSGSLKMIELFDRVNIPFSGPVSSLEEAVELACSKAVSGFSILFSPGCASFEMFLNEFDRGKKFKDIVQTREDGDLKLRGQ